MNKSILLAILLFATVIHSQEIYQSIEEKFVKAGYENVSTTTHNNKLLVTYENRIFRDEVEALLKVIEIIKRDLDLLNGRDVILIPQNRGIPLVLIKVPVSYFLDEQDSNPQKLADYIDVNFNIDEEWDRINKILVRNKSIGKIDLVFTPKFDAELDEYGDPFKFRIGIASGIETSLGKGSLIKGEYIIPIVHRDFNVGDKIDPFRPGLINLNQTFRLPGSIFFSSSIGLFTENRYGIDFELRKYFFNGIFSIGGNFGFTGKSLMIEGRFETSILEDPTWFIDIEGRLPWYNMTCSLNYGQYIWEDKGFRFDLTRQFGEVDIGFFVIRTESAELGNFQSGGFHFSIPIFPGRYAEPGFVRIKPAGSFGWEYDYKHMVHFFYNRYDTGHSIRKFIKRLQPDYVREQIRRLTLN